MREITTLNFNINQDQFVYRKMVGKFIHKCLLYCMLFKIIVAFEAVACVLPKYLFYVTLTQA